VRPVPIDNPPNPWSSIDVEYLEEPPPEMRLEIYEDHSRQVLAENDSPDVGFRYSVNPYRGCFHGCAYCYARPSHEYLSFGAGTDFERRIVVKPRAPELLREAFGKRSWQRDMVVFSGVTDCYQPLEASYRLTRGCLQVCAETGTPAAVITKAPLVERDIDVLLAVQERARVHVTLSIPFWDADTARAIEPYVATPARRLRTVERLAAAGIPVGVNVAPIIPGLNDRDIPRILEAARDAGATSAAYVLLRLPGSVRDVFVDRLRRNLPLAADRVLHLLRETRGGKLYDARFSIRGRGEGKYAEAIKALFETSAARLGLTRERCQELSEAPKIPAQPAPENAPGPAVRRSAQLSLFLPASDPAQDQDQDRAEHRAEHRADDRTGDQLPRGASADGSRSAQSPHSGNMPAR
jgi:DNA repair photolyase